jgi:ABC-type glycerol-3-phosphate transport system substrate-binding protein
LILQSAPDWPTGWRRLLSFWGNCKSFTDGASDVPGVVAKGQVVAGTCIDYYAFGAIVRSGSDVLSYALPAESAVFTPDPISVLKGAPHPEMAERFVRFVLSPAGQALWGLPPGSEDGPVKHALYRQPIRKDTYATYAGRMLGDLVNPYDFAGDFVLDGRLQAIRTSYVLPQLMRAAAMDNAENLRQAWRILVAKGTPEDPMADFAALPENLATEEAMLATAARIAEREAAGDDKAIHVIAAAWRQFFRDKYKGIIARQ